MNRLLDKAKNSLELATGLWAPSGVEAAWVSSQDRQFGLSADVAGTFRPSWPRTIWLNQDSPAALKHPVRVVVHELAHLVHWDATRFGYCTTAEVERFAVCAMLLAGLRRGVASGGRRIYPTRLKLYHEAEEWFWRQGPEASLAWMHYVLAFASHGPGREEAAEAAKPASAGFFRPRTLTKEVCKGC